MKTLRHFIAEHYQTAVPCLILLAFAITAGSIYGYLTHKTTVARNQAIQRAKNMDGRTFTITDVAFNFIGDTKLVLQNEQEQGAGWIAMHTTNPLNAKINPLFLVFTDPSGRLPLPMKVKARFRETPWTDENTGRTYEEFTGSFVEFEQVQ